jgi:hypothetical protein
MMDTIRQKQWDKGLLWGHQQWKETWVVKELRLLPHQLLPPSLLLSVWLSSQPGCRSQLLAWGNLCFCRLIPELTHFCSSQGRPRFDDGAICWSFFFLRPGMQHWQYLGTCCRADSGAPPQTYGAKSSRWILAAPKVIRMHAKVWGSLNDSFYN